VESRLSEGSKVWATCAKVIVLVIKEKRMMEILAILLVSSLFFWFKFIGFMVLDEVPFVIFKLPLILLDYEPI
jgi:hypothetical protein